jgi:hypothetical protein
VRNLVAANSSRNCHISLGVRQKTGRAAPAGPTFGGAAPERRRLLPQSQYDHNAIVNHVSNKERNKVIKVFTLTLSPILKVFK